MSAIGVQVDFAYSSSLLMAALNALFLSSPFSFNSQESEDENVGDVEKSRKKVTPKPGKSNPSNSGEQESEKIFSEIIPSLSTCWSCSPLWKGTEIKPQTATSLAQSFSGQRKAATELWKEVVKLLIGLPSSVIEEFTKNNFLSQYLDLVLIHFEV